MKVNSVPLPIFGTVNTALLVEIDFCSKKALHVNLCAPSTSAVNTYSVTGDSKLIVLLATPLTEMLVSLYGNLKYTLSPEEIVISISYVNPSTSCS